MADSASSLPASEAIRVEASVVRCDGGDPGEHFESLVSGHPAVYLNMGAEGRVACPYCSRKFVLVERS